jgi:hypothetical protein
MPGVFVAGHEPCAAAGQEGASMRERKGERAAWTEYFEGRGQSAPASKYGNKRVFFNDRWYDSQREASHAAILQALEYRGAIKDLQYQVRVPLVPSDGKLRGIVWVADFVYKDALGYPHYVDVKGFKTAVYRLKKRMAALLLNIQIEEV